MTTVTLAFVDAWLTLASDPTLSVHASYPDRGHHAETAGEFRPYAGGRIRVITSARKMATFPLTMQLLSDADVALLESWQGQVVLLRDGEGRRVWGSYLAGDVESFYDAAGTLNNMALTFTAVTFDESV
jgi:hypothetical protein